MIMPDHPTALLWRQALSTDSVFCDALVSNEILTRAQMEHAAERYRLGASRSRGVIFWQIDKENRIHDGKIMYYLSDCHRNKDKRFHPTWVSAILQKRYQWPDTPRASHCLFGLHLTSSVSPQTSIAIVEAEKTAVILSEIYPQYLWLATGGLGEVQPEKFRPLRGYHIMLIPDTDSDGTAFKRWSLAAQEVQHQPWWDGCPPLEVSSILEHHATPDQKHRKIDLADYYIESIRK
jgi:hypothetical protein